jgi:hypothetical protein
MKVETRLGRSGFYRNHYNQLAAQTVETELTNELGQFCSMTVWFS